MKATTKLFVLALLLSSQVTHGQWQVVDIFDNGHATHLNASDDYLFAATKGGIYRSNNPEEGWEKLDTGDEIHDHWKVHVFDDVVFSLIYLQRATNNGDDGFELVNWEDGSPHKFRFMAQKGDTLITKRIGSFSLHTSTDIGETWTPLELFPNSLREIVCDEDYCYLIESGLFHRTQNFTDFELLSSDFPVDDFNEEWQDALVTDNSVLILQETGAILYSDDQGSTWEYAQTPNELGNNSNITDWDYHENIVVASVSSPENGLLLSENSGQSWEFYPSPLPYHFVSVAFFQGELYVAPKFSGIQKVEFSNEELELTPAGGGVTVASANDMVQSGDHIYIHRKYEGLYESQTQFETASPFSGLPPSIDWETDEVFFAPKYMDGAQISIGNDESQFFYKQHEDNTWVELPWNDPNLDDPIIGFEKKGSTIVLQHSFHIRYTANGGENWQVVPEINPFGIEGAVLYNNGRLFFNANYYGPGFTEDFGQNVEFPNVGLGSVTSSNPAHTLFAHGENLLFLSYNKRAISHDNGDTWITLDNPSRFEVAYARDSIVVATWKGRNIYISSNFGESFEPLNLDNSGLPMYAKYENVFFDNNRIYLSVKNGNIYYSSPMSFTSIEEKSNRDMTFYPNPASDRIWFNSFQQSVQLSVYSVQGQLLDQIALEPNTNSLNVNHLPVGIYLLDFLNINGERITQSKLLIQR